MREGENWKRNTCRRNACIRTVNSLEEAFTADKRAAWQQRLTSLALGTGIDGEGCLVPHLTRLTAGPCEEARRGAIIWGKNHVP